ncbi:MAG: hypothetical protein FWE50_03405 [Alphaproteobacteria bacterium]|nr:hypothetical protein [Alphaproteobacteria bacterium]
MKKLYLIFAVFSLLFIGVTHAADTSCEDERNEYVNQRLALCTVHAYNIGKTSNPTGADEKQLMQDVVALKATITTQQMKKQYDFLDTTLKRFKVQLEKAVLMAQAQTLGAPEGGTVGMSGGGGGGSGGSSATSKNRNVVITGAEDCTTMLGGISDSLACLRRNYAKISSETSVTNARKQLEIDLKIFRGISDSELGKEGTVNDCGKLSNIKEIKDCLIVYSGSLTKELTKASKGSNSGGFVFIPSDK